MKNKKYILISIEDEKAESLAKVLGSKTCKKIIDFLAEKEASEKEIADALKIPMNTVEYNLKKLIKAELIEKTKNFFWSKKGKKIVMYQLSNKSIIISPKSTQISSKVRSILPVAIISGIGAIIVRQIFIANQKIIDAGDAMIKSASLEVAQETPQIFVDQGNIFMYVQPFPIWGWFLAGAMLASLIFIILNWRKL